MYKKLKDKIVIFGCGGHARSIINTIREFNKNIKIILVDENANNKEIILKCEVRQEYKLKSTDSYIVAVGDNNKREKIYTYLINNNIGYCISVISKYSHIGIDSKIGKGNFVAYNTYIGPESEIGNNTIINTNAVIEHEVKIGNNTHIAPNTTICGRTVIGNNVFCGAGSIIIDKISICDNVIIGAGSVVKENIIHSGVYIGIPAKKIS